MKRLVITSICALVFFFSNGQLEKKYLNNETYTYDELLVGYQRLSEKSDRCQLLEAGPSDYGKPIYVFLIAPDSSLFPKEKNNEAPMVMINNAIHPGESCGVDASLHFAEDVLNGKIQSKVWICIITAYNVGGMHNRRSTTRANQNGPIEQGFRGNANNYDLNRDFTKMDALNTEIFTNMFSDLKPHFFIDNHTTNGADYQYEQTLIFSPKEKLPKSLQAEAQEFKETVFKELKRGGVIAGNFVNIYSQTPDKGFAAFHETPIYSTGYTSLYNTFSIVSETHMLKDYPTRVEATYTLMKTVVNYANLKGLQLAKKMEASRNEGLDSLVIAWEIDSSKVESLKFKGYAYEYTKSQVTGGQRLKYLDKKKTYTINYYGTYKPSATIQVPAYYIIPTSWRKVIQRLEADNIEMIHPNGEEVLVEAYYIQDYSTSPRVYEGHYPHQGISLKRINKQVTVDECFVLVPTNQPGKKLIVHLLEPQAEGSLFSWNYFDPILQQKEGYSSYVFEDTALELLEQDAGLKAKFEAQKKENPEFANNPRAQLYFIYKNSSYYEPTHNLYPVYRLMPP